MPALRINGVFILLAALLVFLQYRLWFEQDGVRDMLKLKKSMAVQEVETANLKKRNEELVFQVKRLQKSRDATEARARSELGMVKKGETFYQFVK